MGREQHPHDERAQVTLEPDRGEQRVTGHQRHDDAEQ